jgi:hypothetical protein
VRAANQVPVVAITSPAPGTSVIGPATILLESSASSSDSTITNVTYFKGTTKIATETAPPYQYTWTKVVAGTYSITAIAKDALGLSGTSNAVALTVSQDPPPIVSIAASPSGGSTLIGPATISLSAAASSSSETIVSVSFYNGTKKLSTSIGPSYEYTWKNVAAGSYALTAVATDSLGSTGVSDQ